MFEFNENSGAVFRVEEHDGLSVGPDPGLGGQAADLLGLQISAMEKEHLLKTVKLELVPLAKHPQVLRHMIH